MNDTAFVTCIYNNLHATSFGGRNNRNSRYIESLKCIAETNAQIYCFVSKKEYDNLLKEFQNHKNILLIPFELEDFPYHNKIKLIKNEIMKTTNDPTFWNNRCVEIMWGKFFFVNKIINECKNLKKIYWIDAGLSHRDVISPKYTDADLVERHITERNYLLFNDTFVDNMNTFVKDKVLLIMMNSPHSIPIPEKYNKHPYKNHHGATGGLFGGDVTKMQELCSDFFEKVEKIIENNELYGEENIMGGLYADHEDFFEVFLFDSWYHEGWGDWYNPKIINYSNFFDLIKRNEKIIKPKKKISVTNDEIIFCTLAVGEKYKKSSAKLIESLNDCGFKYNIVVVTDDVKFYDNYETVIPVELKTNLKLNPFPYNLKNIAIEESFNLNKNIIIFLDADCFVRDLDLSYFNNLKEGLTVNYHNATIDHITNKLIANKVMSVNNKFNNNKIRIFKEQTLIFKVEDKELFRKFINKWKEISQYISENNYTHCAECTDISTAAYLTNYKINEIILLNPELRSRILTTIFDHPALTLI